MGKGTLTVQNIKIEFLPLNNIFNHASASLC